MGAGRKVMIGSTWIWGPHGDPLTVARFVTKRSGGAILREAEDHYGARCISVDQYDVPKYSDWLHVSDGEEDPRQEYEAGERILDRILGVTGPESAETSDSVMPRLTGSALLAATLKDPPRAVLDGRGRKQGPVWEKFCWALATLVEYRSNGPPHPQGLTSDDVAACVKRAQ